MAFNPEGATEVPLSTFGGLVTEVSATDLPEGVSPDNAECAFVPGSVFSRAGFRKVFGTPFPAGGPSNLVPTVVYGKSYVAPNGTIYNIYLDSNGSLWLENFSASPGTYTLLSTVRPGALAKSITAFGREYIALSNGLNGSDVPLQFDGTNLDRVTQDGPGNPPTVVSLPLPSVALASVSPPAAFTITGIFPPAWKVNGYYTEFGVFTTAGVTGVAQGDTVTIAGTGTVFDGIWNVLLNPDSTGALVVSAFLPGSTASYTGGGSLTVNGGAAAKLTRAGNFVTATTSAAHNLQVGYQALIAGVAAATIGGSISSIVVNNENVPGIATVTTAGAHGLIPNCFVSLLGVAGVAVGSGIASITRQGQVVTITTTAPHGLSPGASITIAGVTPISFNSTGLISQVTSTTTFTMIQVDVDASGSGGTVTVNWPVANTPTPFYYQVISTPTPTSFQVSLNYSDGTWTTGTVSFAWDGTFYVSAVNSPTEFVYRQYGPNATANGAGTVTPYGQASPGIHQCQVAFLTRQGYITRPSPPVTFVANGGQYISVSDIPIGPANVVARILLFTGAQGAYFFYIPVAAQINGQVVSTATQIADNTTMGAILDFSDTTLFSSIGTSIPGNNIANQIVLDGALSFGFYGSRLLTYGQRNRIQNLLNLGFDGGYSPSNPTIPTGWQANSAGGTLGTGRFGGAWVISIVPSSPLANLTQSFYQDGYGAPIAQVNTSYRFRAWFQLSAPATDVVFTAAITSASLGFTATATVSGALISTTGGYLSVVFDVPTPATIPTDLLFGIFAQSSASTVTLTVDEMSVIYAQQPFLDTVIYGSYVNNPEAFDGVSGKFGPSQDTRKVMEFGIVRKTLYILTREPSGRLHSVANNGNTEPAGWEVDEVGANCGVLSAFALTKSQADDSSAGGGEEWFAWASSSGARIFGGDQPWKISQEIQPNWDAINPAAAIYVWALNDPSSRTIYFGVPNASSPACNLIYAMSYRQLDTPAQIYAGAPIHTTYSGKLVATDNVRKWSPWHRAINGAALMYRAPGKLSVVLFNGNGLVPGIAAGTGNIYTLDPALLTDDNYGQISPYYVTYPFVSNEQEVALKLGGGLKILAYFTAYMSGVGNITITPYCDTLTNNWPLVCSRVLSANPTFDLEWAGGSATAQRMFFKIASSPATGTDNSFNVGRIMAYLRKNARLGVRGSAS